MKTEGQQVDADAGFDKAGSEYWNNLWKVQGLPRPMDPHGRGLRNHRRREFHQFFVQTFKDLPAGGKKLIEVGCAQSYLLPYFARYLGFEVAGLERSPVGCESSRQMLQQQNVNGEIYCGDLFQPPDALKDNFDVVYSEGLVEHFIDTSSCVKALAALAKPGGMVLTLIPNFAGAMGAALKTINRANYDIHVPLDREALQAAHRDAGLDVRSCNYFQVFNLGVLNIGKYRGRWLYRPLHWSVLALTAGFTLVHQYLPLIKPNRITSPYTICVAIKPHPMVSRS